MNDSTAHHPYAVLTPDKVMDALSGLGLWPDGRLLALSSYENRVYRVHLDEPVQGHSAVVVKFYRPGRWSRAQIQEEHDFAAELVAGEVPMVAPLQIQHSTLHHADGFDFSVTPGHSSSNQSGSPSGPDHGSPRSCWMSGRGMPVSCFMATSSTMAMPGGAVSSPGGRPRPAPPMMALRNSFELGFGMVLSVMGFIQGWRPHGQWSMSIPVRSHSPSVASYGTNWGSKPRSFKATSVASRSSAGALARMDAYDA